MEEIALSAHLYGDAHGQVLMKIWNPTKEHRLTLHTLAT
jgi:hypothetical protein